MQPCQPLRRKKAHPARGSLPQARTGAAGPPWRQASRAREPDERDGTEHRPDACGPAALEEEQRDRITTAFGTTYDLSTGVATEALRRRSAPR